MSHDQETTPQEAIPCKKRGWETPLLPIACFALASATPAQNWNLFAAFVALGWFTAVRMGRPVIAFYGSISIIVIGYLHMFIGGRHSLGYLHLFIG